MEDTLGRPLRSVLSGFFGDRSARSAQNGITHLLTLLCRQYDVELLLRVVPTVCNATPAPVLVTSLSRVQARDFTVV